jgi:hypothetical protein
MMGGKYNFKIEEQIQFLKEKYIYIHFFNVEIDPRLRYALK